PPGQRIGRLALVIARAKAAVRTRIERAAPVDDTLPELAQPRVRVRARERVVLDLAVSEPEGRPRRLFDALAREERERRIRSELVRVIGVFAPRLPVPDPDRRYRDGHDVGVARQRHAGRDLGLELLLRD